MHSPVRPAGRGRPLSRSALAGLDLWRLFSTMSKISYAGYRFPPEIIQQAIWLLSPKAIRSPSPNL
jgi:hypothetical protein